jgi:TrkA domain protein
MAEIDETPLPGVGVRYGFELSGGDRLSVVHHHSGRIQLYLADEADPDTSRQLLDLDEDDARVLAELLGTSQIVREIDRLQQSVAGLSIEWLELDHDTAVAGRTIGDLEIRSTTGVTVVAVLRENGTLPVPGPDFVLQAGDTVVVVGRPADIRRIDELLR